jgi:type II secretory pathway component PulC
LLVITLVCIGAVEGGYTILEYLVFRQPVKEEIIPPAIPAIDDAEGRIRTDAKRDYRIILTRNLFGPSAANDTPPPSPAPVAADIEMADLGIVLVGTIGDSEGTHRAIILDKKTHKQELYKVEDVIQGARVREILRGKVIVVVNGKDQLLDMSEAAKVRPVVKTTAAPVIQPSEIQAPVPAGGGVDDAPRAMEEPEEIAPEDDSSPSQESASPDRKVVRPRIIRPARPSGNG